MLHITLVYDPISSGLRLGWELDRLFGAHLEAARLDARMLNHATWSALMATSDPAGLKLGWQDDLRDFERSVAPFLLYR